MRWLSLQAPRASATQAQVLNNCIDCLQNVFSKKLLSTHYNYVNLQFYTSAAALTVQLPLMLYNHLGTWMSEGTTMSFDLAFSLSRFAPRAVDSAYLLVGDLRK